MAASPAPALNPPSPLPLLSAGLLKVKPEERLTVAGARDLLDGRTADTAASRTSASGARVDEPGQGSAKEGPKTGPPPQSSAAQGTGARRPPKRRGGQRETGSRRASRGSRLVPGQAGVGRAGGQGRRRRDEPFRSLEAMVNIIEQGSAVAVVERRRNARWRNLTSIVDYGELLGFRNRADGDRWDVIFAGLPAGMLRVGVEYPVSSLLGVVLIKGGNHKLVVELEGFTTDPALVSPQVTVFMEEYVRTHPNSRLSRIRFLSLANIRAINGDAIASSKGDTAFINAVDDAEAAGP